MFSLLHAETTDTGGSYTHTHTHNDGFTRHPGLERYGWDDDDAIAPPTATHASEVLLAMTHLGLCSGP